ncbi:hypothetical protein Vsou_19140 [Vulcanisaeta souniana JCM 11219]|uniref:Uncharacterized protein n=1 Tax=Vulcanisaeta souniana JCM 11219 TaxID=1293586 RepID=A0ABN6SUN2_9CREN|nr:hypothetical protein Vsou_19140 [Vulcanisaeta souniana JCM 11219]
MCMPSPYTTKKKSKEDMKTEDKNKQEVQDKE